MNRICFFLILVGFLSSCEKTPVRPSPASPTYVRINTFTKDKMTDQYYWADEVKDKEIESNLSPETYFATMKYSDDHWSCITTSQGVGEIADADGYDNGFGYNLTFWEKDGYIIADVNFVYPNTPAAKAGLKRGDLITRMNGEKITTEDYTRLYHLSSLSIGLSQNEKDEPYKTLNLTAQVCPIDPILEYGIIPQEDKTIGYIVYTSFVYRDITSLKQLDQTFQTLKKQNIDELILDLRYNTGGYMHAAKHLCSLLAPEKIVEQEEIIIHKSWNNTYQQIYAGDSSKLEERFDKTVSKEARLNLSRLWVITSRFTASASELLISALAPYMQVSVIGETTYGKDMGGITFTPTENDLKNWNINLISIRYTNSRGESVAGGIPPLFTIQEPFHHQYELGNTNEPVLAATLRAIQGLPLQDEPTITSRSATSEKQYKRMIPSNMATESLLLFEHEK